jgi:hypothetical protein
MDRAGLEAMAERVTENFNPGTPAELEAFLSEIDIEQETRATTDEVALAHESVDGVPPEKWLLRDSIESQLRERRYRFRGPFDALIPEHVLERESPARSAVFYRYELVNEPSKGTVLYLPGLGVSDFAFRFIHRFFLSILRAGWDLAIYVPPFHLERAGEGDDMQYNLLSSNIETNIRYQMAMIKEVRTMIRVLKQDGAGPVGAWGGSMGASTLLLSSQWEELDHASMMIPIVDWNVVLAGDICMEECVPAFREAGFDEDLVTRAYSLISPAEYPLAISAERVAIQAAQADQLTPPAVIEEFAHARGVDSVKRYRGSHATILLNSRVYRDYAKFLASLSSYR